MNNLNYVEQEEGIFYTWAQFVKYLESQGLVLGDSFTSAPIQIVDSDDFDKFYRVANVYQSGLIHYVAK